MQKKSLIPTPLIPEAQSHKKIEIVEPALPGGFRFLRMMLFIYGLIIRHYVAKLWPGLNRNYGPVEKARHLRQFMEKMGGLWVKTGQIVALRRDVFSDEFCTELAKLQDRAQGFPLHYAREVIETELGKPLDEVFSEFPETPLAAASIGQTYRARLREPDVEVVVKVRRPTIEQSFKADLRYVRYYTWFLAKVGFAPHFRWIEMYQELEHAILDELDYCQEAATLRRMRKNLRSHKVYVPKVFLNFCSPRVLVMEMVHGVYMSDYIRTLANEPERVEEWLRENKIDPFESGKRLLFSHYRQLFEDNLYHCDLHPGNILLMKKNRITLIDFGSVGSTDKTQLIRYLNTLRAFVARDYRKMADLWLLLSPTLPSKDLTEYKDNVVRLWREFEQKMKIKAMPYHEKSIAKASGELAKLGGDAEVPASWEFLRQLRAQLTVDSSLMVLMPTLNYQKIIKEFLDDFRDRESKAFASSKLIRAQLARISDARDVPTKLAENAYFEGEYMRRRAIKYEGYVSKASQIGRYMFLGASRGLAVMAVAMVIVGIHQRYNVLKGLYGTWIHQLIKQVPRLEISIWVCVAVAAIYISREFMTISQLMEEPAPTKTGGDRR